MTTTTHPLIHREWQPLPGIETTTKHDFTIMTWNILADSLAHGTSEAHALIVPKKVILTWKHRAPLILAEIDRVNPDILCLQEVDHYYDWLVDELQTRGYHTTWCPKQKAKDGIVIAWKISMFDMLQTSSFTLHDTHSQVAARVILGHCNTQHFIDIGTTHLKSKPSFSKVRLEEMFRLIHHFPRVIFNDEKQPTFLSIIVGDFNDIPSSDTCSLLSQYMSRLEYPGHEDEPAWTTMKKRHEVVQRTIDHVYSNNRGAEPVAIWSTPSKAQCPNYLPAVDYPSDHIALAVRYKWI